MTCQNMLQYYTENCLFVRVTLRLNQRQNIELGGGRKIIGCEGTELAYEILAGAFQHRGNSSTF